MNPPICVCHSSKSSACLRYGKPKPMFCVHSINEYSADLSYDESMFCVLRYKMYGVVGLPFFLTSPCVCVLHCCGTARWILIGCNGAHEVKSASMFTCSLPRYSVFGKTCL